MLLIMRARDHPQEVGEFDHMINPFFIIIYEVCLTNNCVWLTWIRLVNQCVAYGTEKNQEIC